MAYDIETIVWTVALLASVVTLVWLARSLRRGIRVGGNLNVIPDELSREMGIRQGDFAARREKLGGDLIRAAAALPAQDRDLTHHALWHAMLLEAGSDGAIDAREVRFIAEFFGRLSGRRLAADSAVEAADYIAANPQRALGEVAKARGASPASRRCIIESAMLVSLANGELVESEAARLGDIADALGLGLEERRAIYAQMTRRLRG